VRRIQPVYPAKALKDRARGTVVLTVHVSAAGAPMKVDVKRGVRADIDAAAVAAAMQWRFEPATKNGRPVRTTTEVRFAFEGVQFARTPFPSDLLTPTPPPAP
jgi:protein TonB